MIINGIEYVERQNTSSKNVKIMLPFMALAMMIGGNSFAQTSKHEYDLVNEFKLIQDKKSNLSRSEREHVIRLFNRKYIVK
jgi:hypothetical protein